MFSRLLKIPVNNNKSFFLFGPRGTGKTTWIKSVFSEAVYFDLLKFDLYNDLLARPGRLENLIPQGFQNWIILDEIQRIPELLNEVHRLIETFHYKFILTGSSARTLRKKGVNLLAGRALTYKMYPLTAVELGDSFCLKKSLAWGHLPSISSEKNPNLFLKAYVQTYLREEILQEGLTRNLGSFSRFLETASFSQGSVLNITEIARESGIERMRVTNYFSILEDLLLASLLPVFTRRAKRRMISHPKFYFFDVGIFRTLRPMGPLDSPQEAEGPGLETLCFQELSAINDYYNYEYNLYYWRTSNGVEVDFILYGPKGLLAFEIKRSSRISKKDLNGLKLFANDYPEAKLYMLYGGSRQEYVNNISILPVEKGLKELPSILQNRGQTYL
ncbi:MAG: AAA family ATPase [Thermodesulfobacteriota bacterium]|nr:AAA family ATPase [Thermodesulfobacteriota bacterium]